MERSKMRYCTTLHVSWKWNYGGLKFIFKEAFCVLRMRNERFFIFERLCLVTDVSYGDGKGIIFLNFASSLIWCEQFAQEKLFI